MGGSGNLSAASGDINSINIRLQQLELAASRRRLEMQVEQVREQERQLDTLILGLRAPELISARETSEAVWRGSAKRQVYEALLSQLDWVQPGRTMAPIPPNDENE